MRARLNVVVTENLKGSGEVAYWRLHGALDVARLREQWEAADLPERLLPQLPGPATALSRAVREQQKGRTLVRPLEGKKGYAVVSERAAGDDLKHAVELRVRLDAVGRLQFASGASATWARADACGNPLAGAIAAAYERHVSQCAAEDVGPWMVRLVSYVDGVGLREGGGIYYVPPFTRGTWGDIVACIQAVSEHRVFSIPAMRAEETMAAVLDAIEHEARAEFDGVMQAIGEEGVGVRALANRHAHVEGVEAKVGRYEELLGVRLDSMRERLTELRAALAAATLKAEAAAAANKAAQ